MRTTGYMHGAAAAVALRNTDQGGNPAPFLGGAVPHSLWREAAGSARRVCGDWRSDRCCLWARGRVAVRTLRERRGVDGSVAGRGSIVTGRHGKSQPWKSEPSRALGPYLQDAPVPRGTPARYHLLIGHVRQIVTVPLGARARLGASTGTLQMLESGVAAE